MALHDPHLTSRTAQRVFALFCLLGLTAGVPWVESIPTPGFDGRQPLTPLQLADKAFARGRHYYVDAQEFEDKAQTATTDVRRSRYLGKAYDRYRASADAYNESLKRARTNKASQSYLPQLYLEMATALFKIGQHSAAVESYDEAIGVAPAYLGARFGRARAHLALNQLDAAKEDYTWLLREADTRSDAWVYVDALMQEFGAWPVAATRDTVPEALQTQFKRWLSETKVQLDETIRWTALEEQAQ